MGRYAYNQVMNDHPSSGPDAAELVDRARRLAPALRERARAAEELRRCPDETIADFHAAEFLKAVQPARFGGFEMGWDVLCEISMELARGCGGQAWVATVLIDHKYIVGLFHEQAQRDVWDADENALITASIAPVGKAEGVDGGYILSGHFGFSSGAHHADWVIVGAMADTTGGKQPPVQRYFLVPDSDINRIDNWRVVGLASSGSIDFEIHDAFVPAHRVIDIDDAQEGCAPGASLHKGAVFRMPQRAIACLGLASPSIGIAQWVLDDFIAMTRSRISRGSKVAEWQSMQLRIAESSAEIDAARLLVLTTARRAMATLAAGEVMSIERRAESRRNACYAATMARRSVDRLFDGAGGHGLYLDNDLQRGMRDAKAAVAHLALGWDMGGTTYGRVALGLDPGPGSL
jgi:resorcinol 4-hydroxylase (FADH2)